MTGLIVAPFTIHWDHREEPAQYTFQRLPFLPAADRRKRRTLVVPVERTTLRTGDYTIAGLENHVAVERKSLTDLYGTLSNGRKRDRFKNELARMAAMARAVVVIEATWEEICNPRYFHGAAWRSKLSSRSVWSTIYGYMMDYPTIPWLAMGTKRLAELATFSFLAKYHKRWTRKEKEMALANVESEESDGYRAAKHTKRGNQGSGSSRRL